MSLYKRAYARGINDELIRLGFARYATKEAADAMADAVGNMMNEEPAGGQPVSPDTAADVSATLIDAANKLVEATGGEGVAADNAPMLPQEEALKTSAAQDLDTRAFNQAYALLSTKIAADINAAKGSTIEGGDKGNDMTNTTAAETLMEAKNRPQGTHVMGVQNVGQTTSPAGRGVGVIGAEEVPAPNPPKESPEGTNTVIQQSKMGAVLREVIQKVAMGSTIQGGDKGNTLQQAAGVMGEAAIEAKRRPDAYANMGVMGVGNTDHQAGRDPQASVGHEVPHPHQPGASAPGAVPGSSAGNTVVQQSNASKKAEEDPYISLFRKTAEEVGPHLPQTLSDDAKVAHIRHCMGMDDAERNQYIGLIYKEAGATDTDALAAAEKHAACVRERKQYTNSYGHTRTDRRRTNQKTGAELTPAQEKLPEALKNAIKAKQNSKETYDTKTDDDKSNIEGSESKEGQLDLLTQLRQVMQAGTPASV